MNRKAFALAGVALLFAACNTGSQSLAQDQKQTDKQLQQYQVAQPVPFYDWSEQRNTLIQIYNAKNEARQTWAVLQTITGVPVFSCPSIGFPIPADTQLTNPSQISVVNPPGLNNNNTLYDGVVHQMEPDGLYASGATDATYVLCLRPDGKAVPIYTEQKVTMFPFPVTIQDGKIVDSGAPSNIEINVKGGNAGPTPSDSPKP